VALVTVLAVIVFAAGFMYIGMPYLYMRLLRRLQANRVARDRSIVLTFDDGPGRVLTPAVLALLAEYDVKATFFVLGRNIEGREDILAKAVAQGHEIGSHGQDHLHSWKVSPWRALADVRVGHRKVRSLLHGDGVVPFRPPYGKANLFGLLYLVRTGTPICSWTLDTRDTWSPGARDIGLIGAAVRQRRGSIVLAHDFDRSTREVNDYVLGAIRSVLEYARANGMAVRTMGEVLYSRSAQGQPISRPGLSRPGPSSAGQRQTRAT
jgi:peptidoglycan/xylan/chitin deacetylase (PgdA/CDA1 family)